MTSLAVFSSSDEAKPRKDVATTQPARKLAPLFASDSPINTEISQDAPIDPNSSTYVDQFIQQYKDNFGTISLSWSSYAPPVYVVDSGTPVTKMTWNNCQHQDRPDEGFLSQISAVPIPLDAHPSDGTDAAMTIWQPSTDTLWDFWQMRKVADGSWSACWGGKLTDVSKSSGVFNAPYGSTATGITLLAGLIRPEELEQGEIDHALAITIVKARSHDFVSPANRTDGNLDDPLAIPEGQRFRLDPNVDVDSLKMSNVGKTIARAIQRYGCFVRDTGGAVSFYAENVSTAGPRLPGGDYSKVLDGAHSYDLLNGFPWQRLQAVAP